MLATTVRGETFYVSLEGHDHLPGGHDPKDYQHFVGDPPTNLVLHPNSPGYRLTLNNILFPAARKKEWKTWLSVLGIWD